MPVDMRGCTRIWAPEPFGAQIGRWAGRRSSCLDLGLEPTVGNGLGTVRATRETRLLALDRDRLAGATCRLPLLLADGVWLQLRRGGRQVDMSVVLADTLAALVSNPQDLPEDIFHDRDRWGWPS